MTSTRVGVRPVDEAGVDPVLLDRLVTRWYSDRPIHRYIHREKMERLLRHVPVGSRVLDIGRGGSVDGIFGVLAAVRGSAVTITTPTQGHSDVIAWFAERHQITGSLDIRIAEPDAPSRLKFDFVAALHVLEHVHDPRSVLVDIRRQLTEGGRALVALPTCTNPAVWCRLGGGDPYAFSPANVTALARGAAGVLAARVQGLMGFDESVLDYGVPIQHRWYFPRQMRRLLSEAGFRIDSFHPDSVVVPWWEAAIPASRVMDSLDRLPVLRDLGFGSHAVLTPVP